MDAVREKPYLLRLPRREGMLIDAFVFASREIKVEDSALEQLRDAARVPSVERALGMPDIHHGFGVPIGSVVATRDAVIPAAVGYDINCGMRLLLGDRLAKSVNVVRSAEDASRDVPLGEGKKNVRFGRDDFISIIEGGLPALLNVSAGKGGRALEFLNGFRELSAQERIEDGGSLPGVAGAVPPKAIERGMDQLGTLGGGNHFIEFQVVERILEPDKAKRLGLFEGQFTVMLHTGSRGFGHEVGGHYMKLAKDVTGKGTGGGRGPGLSYFASSNKMARQYLDAMNAAANFAYANRAILAALVAGNLSRRYPDINLRPLYDVTHNMAKIEEHGGETFFVHRKGSTRAFDAGRMRGTPFSEVGQPVLIPGSMGTASYVLVGTSTGSQALYSVNHGAGRVMSRSRASGKGRKGRREQAAISDAEFKRSMEGVHLIAGNMSGVKEEAPAAYKDIDKVIQTVAEAGLAVPVARLTPLAVLKG